jgi:hypothetical protein
MSYIFVSYSHNDWREADQIIDVIRENFDEYRVWIDNDNLLPGENWKEAIDNAIRQSFALVLIMSSQSEKSKYVIYEWAFASGFDIEVIPVLIESDLELHPKLKDKQHIDFSERDTSWDEKLIAILKKWDEETFIIPQDSPLSIREAIRELHQNRKTHKALAFKHIQEFINSEDWDVNIYRNVINAIVHLSNSTYERSSDWRKNALDLLSKIKGIPDLIELVGGHALIDEVEDVRIEAVKAIGQWARAEEGRIDKTVDYFLDCLTETTDIPVWENIFDQLATFNEYLDRIKREEILTTVVKYTTRQTDKRLRRQSVNTLKALGADQYLSLFMDLAINDIDREVRLESIKALGSISEKYMKRVEKEKSNSRVYKRIQTRLEEIIAFIEEIREKRSFGITDEEEENEIESILINITNFNKTDDELLSGN